MVIHVDGSSVRVVKVTVYGLREPGTKWIRYVGQTKDLKSRLRMHISSRVQGPRDNQIPLKEWIAEMRSRGVKPEMVTLAKVKYAFSWKRGWPDLNVAIEEEYIKMISMMNHGRGGPPLFNVTGNPLATRKTPRH